ncbi:MAG: histidine phosphatase family protein [Leptospiraceae bacterium]|nr:histidine phosphatase family protein [Leptospiraceae bacterium]MDW7975771.1 histidine phosphatase family protein [Leptospiraceae bacterium]
MKFYCIRHGIAEEPNDEKEDLERKLTEKGKERIKALGKVISKIFKKPDLILTSEALRSLETAEVLNSYWKSKKIETFSKLNPGATVMDYVFVLGAYINKDIIKSNYKICLITHEPDLSHFITAFLTKQIEYDFQTDELVFKENFINIDFPLKKGSIFVFDWDGESMEVECYLTPSIVKRIRKNL